MYDIEQTPNGGRELARHSERVKMLTLSKRDAYIAKMHLQLADLNATVQQLDENAKDACSDAREKYIEELLLLRAQARLAIEKLDSLKAARPSTLPSTRCA